VCFAFGGIGCSSVFYFSFLSLIGGEDMAPRVVRDAFFDYFYTINKKIMQSTHSLQLKQTPPAFFSHYLFDIFS